MLERDIEKKVCDYAKRNGWMVRKFSSPSHRSVPDRIMIKNGEVIFIEFKATGKKPTKLQAREHNLLREHTANIYVVDDVQQGKTILAAWEEVFR